MKVAIAGGAGAMGGVWASRLAQGGHDVAVLDVSPPALAAIRAGGLIVERKDGTTDVTHLLATDNAAEIGRADAVIFFTKAYHTAGAADLARPLVDGETTVVSLQNGWGNADTLAGVFPPEQIVMGVTYHSATVRAPGRIAYTNDVGPTFVGPYVDGAPLDRAEAVAAAMSRAGIPTTVSPKAKTEVWKKLILNCATLPTSALTRLYAGQLDRPEAMHALLDALAAEATEVANALGYAIDAAERSAAIHDILSRGGRGKASMLQDVEAQRRTEIGVVNGAVVREADRLGLAVPVNRAMVALVEGLERSWRQDE